MPLGTVNLLDAKALSVSNSSVSNVIFEVTASDKSWFAFFTAEKDGVLLPPASAKDN